MSEPELVVHDDNDGVLLVTLNRPARLNALSRSLRAELSRLWASRRVDPALRCVVLTGAGRAFCAGGDVDELSAGAPADTGQTPGGALSFLPARNLDVPVILAINGPCVGGAFQFLADADFAIASTAAWFSDPHVTMGQVSAVEPLGIVARIPAPAVVQLVLQGSQFRLSAEDAQLAHLVNEVVAPERLVDRALELARGIAAQSPTALRTSLRLVRGYLRGRVADDVAAAWQAVERQWTHPDSREGPLAFRQNRQPRWAPAGASTPEADR